uniref:AlNc14C31G2894 protein n=1 Tax=Albugo laibachii Nc14 TaxID=890382 RepID=F0W7U1_9STRA|nr:AlNc14C31G2894 [Albugo laibachii Nc14]|eukprot:CCA17193.1 AlNc14C31G2894 [Albugo laibachii Nc14]
MKAEKYSKPLLSKLQDTFGGSCLVLYHTEAGRPPCVDCMKEVCSGTTKFYISTRSSSLFDASNCDNEFSPHSFEKLLQCHHSLRCVRIQKVPNNVCSHHQTFVSKSTWMKRAKLNIFTINRIPVGVWPPEIHSFVSKQDLETSQRSSGSPLESTFDLQTWPSSGNIVWVQFEHADFQAFDCVRCLIGHTEVFFVYKDHLTHYGYVWMRPAPAQILSLCIPRSCSSLAYFQDQRQIALPVGLRQVTRDDVPFS